jgi:5S rRNA maturation endonuclease (ribonuclease M5)
MGDNDISCTCKMNEHIITPGKISIDAIDSPCCTNKTFELTNSNNLQKTENDNLKNVFTFSPVIINCDLDFTGSELANSQPALKDHIPKSEIPILISSLLI